MPKKIIKPNSVHNGDCLELFQFIKKSSIDMILCDLPFGHTKNTWDVPLQLDILWNEYKRILKPKGIIILHGIQPFSSFLINSNPKMFKYSLIWQKTTPTGFLNVKKRPMMTHEDINIFFNELPTYNPQKSLKIDGSERYPTSVLTFKTDKQKEHYHPCQKPIKLLEYLISTYSNEGDIVLDNCCGSGSSLLAASNLNRKYIGIEKDEKFYNISKMRVNKVRRENILNWILKFGKENK
jgi:DNA modification methylase